MSIRQKLLQLYAHIYNKVQMRCIMTMTYNDIERVLPLTRRYSRVRTHAVLLLTITLTLTFDLSTQSNVTSRISQGHSLYQV